LQKKQKIAILHSVSKEGNRNLFHLIKALKKSEKRYFKVFAPTHTIGEKNNYIKLFDAIDNQEQYDEKKLISEEKYITQLPKLKIYLYNLILRSLDSYYTDSTIDSHLRRLLNAVELLHNKRLYSQSIKLLSKAKAMASNYDRYSFLLEIMEWERRVAVVSLDLDEVEKLTTIHLDEEKQIIEKSTNLNEYRRLATKIHVLHRKALFTRSEHETKAYHDIMNNKLFRSEKNALSHQAKIFFHNIYGLYYLATKDYIKCYESRKKLVEFIETRHERVVDAPKTYIHALNNLIFSLLNLRKFEESLQTIKKLRLVPDLLPSNGQSEDIEAEVFTTSYSLELDSYILANEFENGTHLAKKINDGIQKYKGKVNKADELVFYYQIAHLFYGAANYKEALTWLNKILNDTDSNIRQDLQCFARLLNLINHYELGNTDMMEYIVKSTYRFLYKRERLYKFETSILNFIRKQLPAITKQDKLIIAFKELKKELEEIAKDPQEDMALKYFDFISWLESKIENRPFADILKEKYS